MRVWIYYINGYPALLQGLVRVKEIINLKSKEMKVTRKDDRTPEQMKTHTYLVTATDKFLSGWGGASGGASKCAWACDSHEKAQKVFDWVYNRSEMKYVNINYSGKWYPQAAHVHIYVVDDSHPALRQLNFKQS